MRRIWNRYNCRCTTSQLQATQTADFDYLHKKQTGGSGQFAGVSGSVEPLPLDNEDGFEFVNKIFEDQLSEHIPACEKGFKDVMEKGPIAAFYG